MPEFATSCVFWTFAVLVAAALIQALLSHLVGAADDRRLKADLEAMPLPEVYVPRCGRCNDERWTCPSGADPVPCIACNPEGRPPPTDEEDVEALLEQLDDEDRRTWAEASFRRLKRWFGQEDALP